MPLLFNITKQQSFHLSDQSMVIGRDSSCNICISDTLLSRAHAEIRRMPNGQYQIADLGSTHGTFLGGQRISESVLVDGDEIVLGATRLRFCENALEYAPENGSDAENESEGIDPSEPYPKLTSIWQTGADFLSNYRQDCDPGQLFQPESHTEQIDVPMTAGTLVSLDIRFLDRATTFRVHARVIEQHQNGENPGLLLEFLKDEKQRQELVVACAKGESIPYFRRRYERVPCRIPVLIDLGEGERLPATAVDISEGGARLITGYQFERGMRVIVTLLFHQKKLIFIPSTRRLILHAKVVSTIAKGLKRSIGVEFIFESANHRILLVDEVATLRSNLSK